MIVANVRVKNAQREHKKERKKQRYHRILTPPKSSYKLSMYAVEKKMAKKFGYDYEVTQSPVLRELKQDFSRKTVQHFGGGYWTKKMGRKQKYEKNLVEGRPLKTNPLLKIFNKLEQKLQRADKKFCLERLKRQFI